ncbi:hypothetical protein BDF14DRAFT_1883853 [Spinellus fusiger]|nr:hypothetical protein BDF14DRAFT_1883853 [Spinellus fusiger]
MSPPTREMGRYVLLKLILFSVALFALPIVTFYGSVEGVFAGNTTYAAGAAAVVANCVVLLYIVQAFMEDGVLVDDTKDKTE